MADRGIDTKEELAKRAKISSFTLRNLLSGNDFRSSTVKSLADALECNPMDLLQAEGYPSPHVGAPTIAA